MVTATQVIAGEDGRSKRSVHITMSLAFLAPDTISALQERRERWARTARECAPETNLVARHRRNRICAVGLGRLKWLSRGGLGTNLCRASARRKPRQR